MVTDLHLIQASDFFSLLNEKVNIRFLDEVKVKAKLVNVAEYAGYSTLERKPFSITFITEGKVSFPQSIYIVEHPLKGEMAIFLVPLGFEGEGTKYEAVFS
jgi:hypothetical protein